MPQIRNSWREMAEYLIFISHRLAKMELHALSHLSQTHNMHFSDTSSAELKSSNSEFAKKVALYSTMT